MRLICVLTNADRSHANTECSLTNLCVCERTIISCNETCSIFSQVINISFIILRHVDSFTAHVVYWLSKWADGYSRCCLTDTIWDPPGIYHVHWITDCLLIVQTSPRWIVCGNYAGNTITHSCGFRFENNDSFHTWYLRLSNLKPNGRTRN